MNLNINHIGKSCALGLDLVLFTKVLYDQALIDLRRNQSAQKRKQRCIAHSIFDRLAPTYRFQLSFDRLMTETTNLLFVNRNVITLHTVIQLYMPRMTTHKIAYFRYTDGSTMRLIDNIYHYLPPCTTCPDVQKCKCGIEDLSL